MSKVVDNYLIMEKIGEGQFSVVHKGKHVKNGELVAVKILDAKKYDENPHIQAMISEEIEALSRIESPFVIRHLRYLRTSNNMYEVYNYFEGSDLNNHLNLYGKLELNSALKIFIDLVSGIKAIHSQCIIHRDIKPENIFLNKGHAVIGDFGLCRILDTKDQLIEGAYGSPMYMSPESLQNMKYGLKSDLYSLGIILFEIIFGNVPYHCNTIEELLKLIHNVGPKFDDELVELPIRVKNLILRLVEPNPDNRIGHQELFNIVLDDEAFTLKYSYNGQEFESNAKIEDIMSGRTNKNSVKSNIESPIGSIRSPKRVHPESQTEPMSPVVIQQTDKRRQSMYQKQYEESFHMGMNNVNMMQNPHKMIGLKKSQSEMQRKKRRSSSKKKMSRRGSKTSVGSRGANLHQNPGLPPTPRGEREEVDIYSPHKNPYIKMKNEAIDSMSEMLPQDGVYFPSKHDDMSLQNAIFNTDSHVLNQEQNLTKNQFPEMLQPGGCNQGGGQPKKNHNGCLQSEYVNENMQMEVPLYGYEDPQPPQMPMAMGYYAPQQPSVDQMNQQMDPMMNQMNQQMDPMMNQQMDPMMNQMNQQMDPMMNQQMVNPQLNQPIDPMMNQQQMNLREQIDPVMLAKNRIVTPQQSEKNLRRSSHYNSKNSVEQQPSNMPHYPDPRQAELFGRGKRKMLPQTPPHEVINSRRTSMGVSPNRIPRIPETPQYQGYSPSEGNLHNYNVRGQNSKRTSLSPCPSYQHPPPLPIQDNYDENNCYNTYNNQNFTFDNEHKNMVANQDFMYGNGEFCGPENRILPPNPNLQGLTNFKQNTETFGKIKRISTKNSLKRKSSKKKSGRRKSSSKKKKSRSNSPLGGMYQDENDIFLKNKVPENNNIVHHSFGDYKEENIPGDDGVVLNQKQPTVKIIKEPLSVINESHKTPPPSLTSKAKFSLLSNFNGGGKKAELSDKIILESEIGGGDFGKKLKRTLSTYGIGDWVEETLFRRSKYKYLIRIAKKTLKLREISNLSVTIILLLMKLAYEKYNQTKKLISIGEIASRHHDPSKIFTSTEFKTLQTVVNSEELPIAMFLSNLKKMINLSQNVSDLVQIEMANLSNVCCSGVQIEALFCSHIQTLIHSRGAFSRVNGVLRYCLDLYDCIDIDTHFRNTVLKGKKFEENKFYVKRLENSESELLDLILEKGFNL